MFKKFGDKIAKKATSAAQRKVKSKVGQAKSKARTTVRTKTKQAVKDFVKNKKKINQTIKGKMIQDFDEFKKAWEKNASDPVEVVMLFLIAAYNYLEDKKKGDAMVTLITPKTYLLDDSSSPTGFKLNPRGDGYLLMHMAENENIVKSYLGGTNENGYEIDEDNLKMQLVGKGIEDRDATIVIQSGGKDFDSPVNLKRNKHDQWKLFNVSNIATGVKQSDDEALDF